MVDDWILFARMNTKTAISAVIKKDSHMFSYHDGCYTSEASTLGYRPGVSPPNEMKHGNQVFRFTRCDYNDGDIAGWNYRSADTTDRMLIIND
jgi:hypothetical protein